MPERDDRLAADLRDYYERIARQPAPDVTGQVMLAADRRGAWLRRWGAMGGGTLALAAVAAVVALALANHGKPTASAPAGSPSPTASPTPASTPTPSPGPSPTAPVVVGGLPAHGFVPTDVTAISAGEWWVLGFINAPPCVDPPSCTRILHTTDGGATFTSIPTPPTPPASMDQRSPRLRFADPADGWLVNADGEVWSTHDGGARWADTAQGAVNDLAASGGSVYAIECPGASCTIASTAAGQDRWSTLPASAGHGLLGHLNVNGSNIWASIYSSGGGPGSLIASTDAGQHFVVESLCNSALGQPDVYAASSTILWATCATGTEASIVRSLDGGQHFTSVAGPNGGIPNSASIGAISGTTAVIGAQALLRTADGGQSYATVEPNGSQWTVVGFTTAVNGFALSNAPQLWRTDDGGEDWHAVRFP